MCAVNLLSSPIKFCNIAVKPYLKDPRNIQVENIQDNGTQVDNIQINKTVCIYKLSTETVSTQKLSPTETKEAQPLYWGRGRPHKYPFHVNTANITVFLQEDSNHKQFKTSC